MRFYKVVTKNRYGEMWSSYYMGEYAIQYHFNQWVYPKLANSKLFVFDRLEDTKDYLDHSFYLELYPCEVLNPIPIDKKVPIVYHSFKDFWDGVNIDINYMQDVTGYWCDAVKLLNEPV